MSANLIRSQAEVEAWKDGWNTAGTGLMPHSLRQDKQTNVERLAFKEGFDFRTDRVAMGYNDKQSVLGKLD